MGQDYGQIHPAQAMLGVGATEIVRADREARHFRQEPITRHLNPQVLAPPAGGGKHLHVLPPQFMRLGDVRFFPPLFDHSVPRHRELIGLAVAVTVDTRRDYTWVDRMPRSSKGDQSSPRSIEEPNRLGGRGRQEKATAPTTPPS